MVLLQNEGVNYTPGTRELPIKILISVLGMNKMKSKLMATFSEKASIEEFINGPETTDVIAPVVTEIPVTEIIEDFGGVTEDPVAEIEQVETVASQLDELATDVDGIKTVSGMESYSRIYNQMVTNVGLQLPTQVSVESFSKTKGGKRSLARQIRKHADHLRRVAALGIEDFVDNVDDRLKNMTEEFRRSLKELEALRVDVDVPDEEVTINEKSIWKMMHVDNKLIKTPMYIQEEESNLKALADQVKKATAMIMADNAEGKLFSTGNYDFLYNRELQVGKSSIKIKDLGTPKAERAYSGSDYGWIAAWTLMFSVVGLVGALLFKSATGKEKTNSSRSKQEMMTFIDTVKKLSLVVKSVDDDIAKLTKYIESKGEEASGYKKDASPVFQLALFIVQQCTDLAKGSRVLFSKIANA